jgi:hypothetical protein
MKVIKFTDFLNENEKNDSYSWKELGPNWLFDYVMSQPGSGEGMMGKISYITLEHNSDEIVVIFFLFENKIRWNWTWGRGDKEDISGMVSYELKENKTLTSGITGDSPKEFVKNVMAYITVEEKRKNDEK